jgi:hypothetical protein
MGLMLLFILAQGEMLRLYPAYLLMHYSPSLHGGTYLSPRLWGAVGKFLTQLGRVSDRGKVHA